MTPSEGSQIDGETRSAKLGSTTAGNGERRVRKPRARAGGKRSKGKMSPALTKKKEEVAQRRAKALQLRKSGNTFEQIGKATGVTPQTAQQDVKKAIAEIVAPDAESFVKFELERLESLYAISYAALIKSVQATAGEDPHLGALEKCLAITKTKANLLGIADGKGVTNNNIVMGDVTVDQSEQQVVIAEGTKDAYIEALKRAREEVGDDIGTPGMMTVIPETPALGDGEIEDAEIIEAEDDEDVD